MWILLAFGSAFFAGITSILAKIGIKNTDSHLATALRTIVILIFSWIMVFVAGSQNTIPSISGRTLLFLCLSDLTTGASWICYFRALQIGDVNKVVPVDKSSTVMTMLLAFLFLKEPLTYIKILAILAIGLGTLLMIEHQNPGTRPIDKKKNTAGIGYAFGSALFASFTAILGKIGIADVESNLGTAIRTVIVLIMAWSIVFVLKKQKDLKEIDRKSWIFIVLSGLATGLSWLCYYGALKDGPASIVVPIDKLSILVTVLFAFIILKETFTKRALSGLLLLTAGTLAMLF